jgi:RimJ/RimL family protein N-acetyltransferase
MVPESMRNTHRRDKPERVDPGYRLRRSAWGKGHATEGSRALIREGFAELGVRRVVAETMAVNAASRRVMEKAGLAHRGRRARGCRVRFDKGRLGAVATGGKRAAFGQSGSGRAE